MKRNLKLNNANMTGKDIVRKKKTVNLSILKKFVMNSL